MNRVNKFYFECEDGHITVSNEEKRPKCTAEEWQMMYIKGKRKHDWTGEKVKTSKKCGKPIASSGEIPLELDYFSVWDPKIMHAFLIGQKFDADFMIGLQKAFSEKK